MGRGWLFNIIEELWAGQAGYLGRNVLENGRGF